MFAPAEVFAGCGECFAESYTLMRGPATIRWTQFKFTGGVDVYHSDGGGVRYVGPVKKKGREKGVAYVPNTFSWIQHSRVSKGWTQQQLAEVLDISRSDVSKIETGRAKLVKASVAHKIDTLCGEDLRDLLQAHSQIDFAIRLLSGEILLRGLEEEIYRLLEAVADHQDASEEDRASAQSLLDNWR